MSVDKMNRIQTRLQAVQEKQTQIKRDLVQHEQLEEHFFEIHKRGDRLFTRLYDVWHKDEELMDIIEQDRIELMTNKRKIINDLREKKNELLKEKRDERDRANDRGAYFTFFHELGHAIDYNYGIENGMDGYYSDYYKSRKKTLAEHMHGDVESRIRAELKNELNKAGYDNLDAKGKTSIINNVARVAIHKGPSSDIDLTNVEEDLFEKIQIQLSGELYTDEYHNVSDVYGGVTLNEILGKWGHHELDYWINEETRERTNEPNKEGFASYYGSIMLQDSEFRNKQIDSVNEYLPNSKQHMDDMFDKINKGGNE